MVRVGLNSLNGCAITTKLTQGNDALHKSSQLQVHRVHHRLSIAPHAGDVPRIIG